MSHGKQIAQNAAWLMAATAAQKVVAFLTFTLIARLVGVEVTGRYFFAVSVTSIFVTLTDLGITPVVIREIAQNEQSGRLLLARALRVKWLLVPFGVLSALAYALLIGVDRPMLIAIALATLVMSCDAVSLLWYGTIRGKRQLRYEALGMFVGQLATAVVSLAAAWNHGGAIGLIIGLLAGSLWNVFWSVLQARRLGIVPTAGDGWSIRRLFHAALPFALAGMFVKVYSYVDTLMLRQFHGDTAVGHYAVAYKVTYAFQFLPLTFVAALYPGMSAAYAAKEKKPLQDILSGSLRLMAIIAVPLTAGLSAFAPRFIPLIYPKFIGSLEPMSILPWVLLPIFLDFPVGSLLNATHRAAKKTAAMGITMVANVLANALLVPTYGPAGAAWAGVGSFWILMFAGAWFVRKDFPGIGWAFSLLGRSLAVSALIWLGIREVTVGMPLPMAVLFAGAISLILLFVFRLLLISDVMMLLRWIKRRADAPEEVQEVHEDR